MSFHLLQILEINHLDINNNILFTKKNIKNILHKKGEEYIFRVLFGGLNITDQYYLGLDSRVSIGTEDTLSTISFNEPAFSNGYSRQAIENSSFSFNINPEGSFQANSPAVIFRAVNGSWGPVRNLFLSTTLNNEGFLISSIPLGNNIVLSAGEVVSMRIGLALGNQ